MKPIVLFPRVSSFFQLCLVVLFSVFCYQKLSAQSGKGKDFIAFKGTIMDSETDKPVSYATIAIVESSIATISNAEGRFELKVPSDYRNAKIEISSVGYKDIVVDLKRFSRGEELAVRFSPQRLKLQTVQVHPKNASSLLCSVLNRREENYGINPVLMTGFYRETIRKRRKYVAVSEAVVEVYKQPFYSSNSDAIRMVKARKNTDNSKLDTLLFKLQGGPSTALMLDIVKDPYMIFSESVQEYYNYTYGGMVQEGDELYYIVRFKQRENVTSPFYYGKITVHAESLAIATISFRLNVENKEAASDLLIRKKPKGAQVYPVATDYMVQYRKEGERWFFNYSRATVEFKVNWAKKWFNSKYTTSFELAITDKLEEKPKPFKNKDKFKSTMFVNEEVSAFVDHNFWGTYNVIRPEQPIDQAIEKIKKNINKL